MVAVAERWSCWVRKGPRVLSYSIRTEGNGIEIALAILRGDSVKGESILRGVKRRI